MKRKRFYANGLFFGCTECGQCCSNPEGFVTITEVEATAIAKQLSLSREDFLQQFTMRNDEAEGLIELKSHANGDCIFLDNERCTVYEQRPLQCRTYPFWPENVKSAHRWNLTALECPGIHQGRRYSAVEIQQIVDKMRK